MYTLYFSPFACSLATHIALEKTGQPYELVKVDLQKQQQSSSDYLEINPLGQVPTLITTLDTASENQLAKQCVQGAAGSITQVGAILFYLAEQHPESKLLPASSAKKTEALQWLFYLSSSVQPLFSSAFYPERLSEQKDQLITNLLRRIDQSFAHLDQHLKDRAFLCGEEHFAVDYFLFAALNWIQPFKKTLSPYPNLQRFKSQMTTLPEVQKVVADEMKAFAA